MNTKLRIKQRREERIRRLLDGAAMEMMQEANPGPSKKIAESLRPTSSFDIQDQTRHVGSILAEQERDPEWLWKKRTDITVQVVIHVLTW